MTKWNAEWMNSEFESLSSSECSSLVNLKVILKMSFGQTGYSGLIVTAVWQATITFIGLGNLLCPIFSELFDKNV
jgi:hypothetical protein